MRPLPQNLQNNGQYANDTLSQFANQMQYQPMNPLQQPMQMQMQPQMGQPPLGQLMQDYEQLRTDVNQLRQPSSSRRPKSRELDLLNLLMIGSLEKKTGRSGFEDLASLYPQLANPQPDPYQQQYYPQDQYMNAQIYPNQNQYNQQQSQYPVNQYAPNQYNNMPQVQQLDQQISPATTGVRKAGQLIVNGQMGLNVEQQIQDPYGQQQYAGSTRILSYVEKQNQVLEELTRNMNQQREKSIAQEKEQLQKRLKELETLNAQDAVYNDMYDEQPPHRQPHHKNHYIRPPPQYNYQQPYAYQQYQPYGAYPPPYAPYPQPPNQQKSKSEILQTLMLMKQLKDMNQKKKRRSKPQRTEYINDSRLFSEASSSEESIEVVQKPRIQRARPIPPPKPYDASEDQVKLLELKSERGKRNLRLVINYFKYGKYIKDNVIGMIAAKKSQTKDEVPALFASFVADTEKWFLKACRNPLEQLLKTPKLNLQIVSPEGKPIKPNQLKINIQKLKEILKLFMTSIVDNTIESEFSENFLKFISRITHDYEYLLDNFYVKFELNRLNYTLQGSLKAMNQNKVFLMYVTNIIIKVVLFKVLAKSQLIAGNELMKDNLKTVVSCLYQFFMLFITGYTAPQPGNTKNLAIQNITKERKEFYYKIETFDATNLELEQLQEAIREKLDDPLLTPVYSVREMSEFFDTERIFVSTMTAIVEGWCETLHPIVEDYFTKQKAAKAEQRKVDQEAGKKAFQPKREIINQLVRQRKDKYLQLNKDIQAIQKRIQSEVEKYEKELADYELKHKK